MTGPAQDPSAPAFVLPPYSPFRRLPPWEPHGRWIRDRPQLTWPDAAVPPGLTRQLLRLLLLVSLVLAVATSVGSLRTQLTVLGLGVLTWAYLEWWLTWDLTPLWRRLAVVVVQFSLVALYLALNPLAGIFGWSAYLICGTLFTGPLMLGAMAVTVVNLVATQVGGWPHLFDSGVLTAGLYAFDLAIGVIVVTIANRREEAVLRRAATTRELLRTQAENAALQRELVEQAREAGIRDERARLARELHDTVAQGLVAVVTQLEAATSGQDVGRRIDRARELARNSLRDARRAVDALHPAELDGDGLAAAIADLVPRWSALHEVSASVEVSGRVRPGAGDQELMRICQESLSNVARHADARRVVVSLTYTDDAVVLDIGDDGRGFEVGTGGGHGLRGMAERAEQAGGRLSVDSEPGRGCVVSAQVPR